MSDFLNQLGEFQEFGDRQTRVILPPSLYPVELTLDEVGLSPTYDDSEITPALVDENGEPIVGEDGEPIKRAAGGVPFLALSVKVVDGPFADVEGQGFSFRQNLSPGKGKLIGFITAAVKAVTGKPADRAATDKYKFQFPNGADAAVTQQLFRTQFFLLDPEERRDFMTIFARAREWDGKKVIIKVGHEHKDKVSEAGRPYTATYHKVDGYFGFNDPKRGLKHVTAKCYPEQQAVLEEMMAATE